MNKAEVSIIVPVYNVENYLAKCIDSLLNQTFDNYEIILVDDGSTDKSGEICDSFKMKSNKIRVIHQKNAKVSAARNAGLRIAEGKFILFCDGDDWVDENYIECLVTPVLSGETELSVSGMKRCKNREGVDCSITNPSNGTPMRVSINDFYELKKYNVLHYPVNKCFLMSIIKENNLIFDKNLKNCEDLCFVLSYIRCIKKDFIIVPESPYYYYLSGNSATNTYYDDLFTGLRQRFFNEFEMTFKKHNIDDDKALKELYTDYFLSFIECINNTFDKRNKLSIIKKLIVNHRIVVSDEYKRCYKNVDTSRFTKLYLYICGSRCALLILAFLKLANR